MKNGRFIVAEVVTNKSDRSVVTGRKERTLARGSGWVGDAETFVSKVGAQRSPLIFMYSTRLRETLLGG